MCIRDSINAQDETIIAKLREIGFAEGDEVEIMHYGPIAKTPICIRSVSYTHLDVYKRQPQNWAKGCFVFIH